MRKIIDDQMKLGEIDISHIEFDLKSRDEIPKLLMGLQAIYTNPETRKKVFVELEKAMPKNISRATGRPGMELWKILVLGTVRLNCGWDYDKLKEITDNHVKIREMIGHPRWIETKEYPLQTLKDNVKYFTPEVLDNVNRIVVGYGHSIKKKAEELKGRCDSFVVESNVHYPTDTNLLYDSVRKSVEIIAKVCDDLNMTNWRQSKSLLKKLRKILHRFQKMRHSNSKDETKKEERKKDIKEVCKSYIEQAEILISRVLSDMKDLRESGISQEVEAVFVFATKFVEYAKQHIDLVRRRVLNGEKIPHDEKVFSIFEEYTEWLSKGKAGVPQELGLNVCIMEDQFGFILNHRIMQGEVDKSITVPFTEETKKLFPALMSCSFDKGFWAPENREPLERILDEVILPKKGRHSEKDKERESTDEFQAGRKQHSAVESGINALENHGLDRCPDRGLKAFKRYVSYAVLARNLQILGDAIQKKEAEKKKRSEKMKQVKRRLAS